MRRRPPCQVCAVTPFAANSQVRSGIFAGTSQVIGVQAVYGYGRCCYEQGHESGERHNKVIAAGAQMRLQAAGLPMPAQGQPH